MIRLYLIPPASLIATLPSFLDPIAMIALCANSGGQLDRFWNAICLIGIQFVRGNPMVHRKTMENPRKTSGFPLNFRLQQLSNMLLSSVVARWGSPIWEWCLLPDLSMARLSFVHLGASQVPRTYGAGTRQNSDTISVLHIPSLRRSPQFQVLCNPITCVYIYI